MKVGRIWLFFFLYLGLLAVFAFSDLGDTWNYKLYTLGLKKDRFEYLSPNPASSSVYEREGVWRVGYGPNYVGLLVFAGGGAIVMYVVKGKTIKS